MTTLSQPIPDLDTLAAKAVEGNKFERVGQNRFKESAGTSPTRTRAHGGSAPDETPSQIQEDGWIEWTGGDRPVDRCDFIDVKFRDGLIIPNKPAGLWVWGRGDLHFDSEIIAYRIVREA